MSSLQLLPTIREATIEKFQSIIDMEMIEKLGKESNLIKRVRKIEAPSFLLCLLNSINWSDLSSQSLSDQCDYLLATHGISMKKQSLAAHYNNEALSFIQSFFQEVLNNKFNFELKESIDEALIKRIRIADSTSFQVGLKLLDVYGGCGGSNGANAGVKLYFDYDYLNGEVIDLLIDSGKTSDKTFNNKAESENKNESESESESESEKEDSRTKVCASDLIIKDLGFWDTSYLEHIDNKGAYYLSRLHSNKSVYVIEKESMMDVEHIVSTYHQELAQNRTVRINCLLKKGGTACQVILYALPQEMANERRRKAKLEAKKKGKMVSKRKLALLAYSYFITNLPEEKISLHQILELYSIRWQTEIMFKIWKSLFKIHKLPNVNPIRFQIQLYAILSVITFASNLLGKFKRYFWVKYKIAISEWKFFKKFRAMIPLIFSALFEGKEQILKQINTLFLLLKNNGKKERKKTNKYDKNIKYAKTPCQIIEEFLLN